ncbi:excinuclease ABC subunit C [Candidatus Shapirobacteria bacterium CG_4_10_14_0_2_um_filter_40_12]|uniref:Excinuclease ABC subunit C n=1 Tax=Candidatus Shapirobacteria bacterium CG_4_10_14_0_2_um_filter_40_12 TaxID=1974871 RepID=A0A2M7TSU9_9BACT|nr:MAG: excinuclease ABC subunit C [Candidatus Shapirobacteria bacterium CG_4_10_14_0_2_um_filter_40_12]
MVVGRYWVYVLLSNKDKRFYVGMTTDLTRRWKEHFSGKVKSTMNRRPLKLIHYEYFVCRGDARSREVFLKSGFGRDRLKQCLKNTLEGLAVEKKVKIG